MATSDNKNPAVFTVRHYASRTGVVSEINASSNALRRPDVVWIARFLWCDILPQGDGFLRLNKPKVTFSAHALKIIY